MRKLVVFCAAICLCGEALADDGCATFITPEQADRIRDLIAIGAYPPASTGGGPEEILTVPLSFHVVRRSNGTGGIPPEQLDQALIDANVAYILAEIQFCVAGEIDYIDDDRFNPLDSWNNVDLLRQTNVVPGTINIYFTETSLFCGISSFTFSSVQGIIQNNACTGLPTNHSTFPHEIGHYFDLFHTHETAFGAECTSGANCATAGDLICDTAADPNVLGQVNSNCEWTGSGNGPCAGDPPYKPDVTNLMSYSSKPCRDNFSPQQLVRARDTLVTLRTELNLQLCDPAFPLGDLNCDGTLNGADIDPFFLALGDPAAYAVQYPGCDINNGDMNGDGAVNGADIDRFFECLGGGCP